MIDIKDPSDSCFLVFRDKATRTSVVKVDSPPAQLGLLFDQNGQLTAESSTPTDTTLTLSDGSKRNLVISTNQGKPALGQVEPRTSKRVIVK